MDEARKWETLGREAWHAYVAYDEANKAGLVRHPGQKFLPTWEEILRTRIYAILKGEDRSFPPDLVPVLAARLRLTSMQELESADFGEGVVPMIEPSSPPPE